VINQDFWTFFNKQGVSKERVEGLLRESKRIVDYERSMIGRGRYWQISKDEVRTMYAVMKFRNPSTVIETGMGPGVSTTTILSAVDNEAVVISIDPDIPYGKGDKELGFVIPEGMKSRLHYVKGTSREMLAKVLKSLKSVDIFFHDSDHTYDNIMFELNTVWPKLSSSSLILIDNYDWTEAPVDFANEKQLSLFNIADDLALLSR
jgi:predicted O-methyltransferase YrrM